METYNLKFITPYIVCSNFKEKDIAFINSVIFGGRLGEKISYVGTGNIKFDNEDKYRYKCYSSFTHFCLQFFCA